MDELEKLSPGYFTWEYWSNGALLNLGLYNKYESIKEGRKIIREYAIGYCHGEKLWVRSKPDTVAVMFWTESSGHFWTHLSVREFNLCFGE